MRPVGPAEEVFCPKCRRYVGTLEKCPYCRARVPTRLSVRVLKWGGLALAIFGILFLYVDLHTTRIIVKETPTVKISELTPMMNYANVYITGKAAVVIFYDYDSHIWMNVVDLDNENADIGITVYDSETKRLIEMEKQRLAQGSSEPKFPAAGDILTVRGAPVVRGGAAEEGGFMNFRVNYAEGLQIVRPSATRISIKNLVSNPDNFGLYQRLEVEGKIIDSRATSWSTILTIYEMGTEAEIEIVLPNIMTRFGRTLTAKVGDTIWARGAFSMYYGDSQLSIASWDDLPSTAWGVSG